MDLKQLHKIQDSEDESLSFMEGWSLNMKGWTGFVHTTDTQITFNFTKDDKISKFHYNKEGENWKLVVDGELPKEFAKLIPKEVDSEDLVSFAYNFDDTTPDPDETDSAWEGELGTPASKTKEESIKLNDGIEVYTTVNFRDEAYVYDFTKDDKEIASIWNFHIFTSANDSDDTTKPDPKKWVNEVKVYPEKGQDATKIISIAREVAPNETYNKPQEKFIEEFVEAYNKVPKSSADDTSLHMSDSSEALTVETLQAKLGRQWAIKKSKDKGAFVFSARIGTGNTGSYERIYYKLAPEGDEYSIQRKEDNGAFLQDIDNKTTGDINSLLKVAKTKLKDSKDKYKKEQQDYQ